MVSATGSGKLWRASLMESITSSLDRARSGELVVLEICGESGSGKSSLLAELVARASGFATRSAECLESDRAPLRVLDEWGAGFRVGPPDLQPSLARGTQAVREFIDAVDGPLLLTIDDLQWADPESLDAVLWVLRRSIGQRLLLAAATRPLVPGQHNGWQRWRSDHDHSVRLVLSGLEPAEAAQLIRREWPAADNVTVGRLWQHTGGNPMYLKELLHDYTGSDFDALRLPAPTEFLRGVTAKLGGASASAIDLMHALAVLNAGWIPTPLAVEVADVEQPEAAIDELSGLALIEVRDIHGSPSLRIAHSLIGSAVYQLLPLPRRRSLHLRAAGLVDGTGAALQHRVAGSTRYDETLAVDLEDHATALYRRRSFRLAAQFQMWASDQTARPESRDRRWLLGQYYRISAGDLATVNQQSVAIHDKGDGPLRSLVLGALAVGEHRWYEGISHLAPWTETDLDAFDMLLRLRIEIVLAWARLCADERTEAISAGLTRALATGAADPAIRPTEVTVRGIVDVRRAGPAAALESLAAILPEKAWATPAQSESMLAARGALRALNGMGQPAVDDLTECLRRAPIAAVAQEIPSVHTYLGLGHWLRGEWPLAQVSLHTAVELNPGHPMALAVRPLVDSCVGRFSEARAAITSAERALDHWPWREAAMYLFIVRVAHAHATDDASAKARLLHYLDRPAGQAVESLSSYGSLVVLSAGQAAIWASDRDYADACIDALAAFPFAWISAARSWIGGLRSELDGDLRRASSLLTRAANNSDLIPFYRAHALVDAGRVARVLSQPGADRMVRRATDLYERLGAGPYLDRISRSRTTVSAPQSRIQLSDRERDILTLLIQGMSYAQIADELFITKKTVSYHLGRLYAKAGVNSRHELTALARQTPQIFEPDRASALLAPTLAPWSGKAARTTGDPTTGNNS